LFVVIDSELDVILTAAPVGDGAVVWTGTVTVARNAVVVILAVCMVVVVMRFDGGGGGCCCFLFAAGEADETTENERIGCKREFHGKVPFEEM
jgi:hypothetical protein